MIFDDFWQWAYIGGFKIYIGDSRTKDMDEINE